MEGFWAIAIVGGPVLLAIALVWGLVAWRRRPVPDAVRNEVTRANYRAEERREERLEERH
jgi:hypothetical protein